MNRPNSCNWSWLVSFATTSWPGQCQRSFVNLAQPLQEPSGRTYVHSIEGWQPHQCYTYQVAGNMLGLSSRAWKNLEKGVRNQWATYHINYICWKQSMLRLVERNMYQQRNFTCLLLSVQLFLVWPMNTPLPVRGSGHFIYSGKTTMQPMSR